MSATTLIPNIDIRPDHWVIVRDILQKHVPQCAVWAFGSRAKWTAKEYSDLDLAIITDQPLSLDISASLAGDFSESDLPWKVDIVDWASTSASFRKVIEQDKVVVQEARRSKTESSKSTRRRPLADLLELIIDHRGKTPKKQGFDDFFSTGIPVLSAKHVKTDALVDANSMRYASSEMYKKWMPVEVQEGDIILTSEAPMGEVFYINNGNKYVLGQRVFGLRPNPRLINPRYLAAWLASSEGQNQIAARASGSTVQGIRQSELLKLEVDLPSKEAQERIANIRFSIANKIDLNRRMNQTLEAMAQAIFKSWFVDFDPVKAKIAVAQGQDPLRAAMRAISGKTDAELDQMPREQHEQLAATAALFPDAMQESELGEIPKGWEVSTIGQMVEIAGGATPDTKNESYWNPPEHFWTSPKDLSGVQSPVLLATERKISTAGLLRIGSGLLPKGTLLMSSRAPIGYLAITQIPLAINQGYIAMPPNGKLPPLYMLMWCQQNMEEIKGQANGSTFMEISKKSFRPIPVIYPESVLVEEFLGAVSPLFEKIVEGVKESSQLSELRDTLLPKLLSGKLHAGSIQETIHD